MIEVIEDCLETPGYELFKYLDDEGVRRDVTSDDVNAYLREAAGAEVTAKDFRTWAATVLAAAALSETQAADTTKENDRQVVAVVRQVSEQLGNTPAICRQAYIHPEILDVRERARARNAAAPAHRTDQGGSGGAGLSRVDARELDGVKP